MADRWTARVAAAGPADRVVNSLTAMVEVARASDRNAAFFLVVIALLAFLPGFFQIPPLDRDETRFAQATRTAIENADYVDIRLTNEFGARRPVGVHVLQAGAVRAGEAVGVPQARSRIWLYRLPSLIGAIGAVLLTYWAALAFVTRRTAFVAALMMATSILLGFEARIATADAMHLAAVIAAMGAMARVYLSAQPAGGATTRWAWPAIFWTALAAGFAAKGPVIYLIVGATVLSLAIADRSALWLRRLRPALGVIWMLLLLAPWIVPLIARGDGAILEPFVRDIVARVIGTYEGNRGPPGYHFLLFWVGFWPGSTLAAMAAPAVWRARREPGARFLLAWLVPSWCVFEFALTKQPPFVLPLYPAVAILCAGVLESRMLSGERWMVRGTFGWFVFPAVIAISFVSLSIAFERDPGFIAWPFAAGSIILGLFAWRLYDVDGAERSLLRAAAASVCLAACVYGLLFPAIPSLFPSHQLADALRRPDCANPTYASAGYHEASATFLLGSDTRLTDGVGAAEFLRQGPCRFALVEVRQERSFVQRADATGLRYAPGPRVEGYNIGAGRRVTIDVFRSETP